MKIFKAEQAMNFNILNGNNNKLNTIRIIQIIPKI